MWFSKSQLDLLDISRETVSTLRAENIELRARAEAAEKELASAKLNADWLRIQYNQVQAERAELMAKSYGIRTPVPELTPYTKAKSPLKSPSLEEFSFDDIGDEVAAKIGLPTYGLPSNS